METYLAHHGILGMKWGVRRYQNEDGSLTSAGKKRYSESDYMKKSAGKTAASGVIAGTTAFGLKSAAKAVGDKASQYREAAKAVSSDFGRRSKLNMDIAKTSTKPDTMLYYAERSKRLGASSISAAESANHLANIARGASTVASIISGVGAVAVIGSAVVSAGQLAYAAYLKSQEKKNGQN